MAKRFTDNEKWKKKWFRSLPCEMKLFWCYICDNCNIAGIWEVDMELASFFIGSTVSEEYTLSCMEKQITVISPSRWMINDFVSFQYGNLVPNNNLHKSVISLLEKSGASQGLVSPRPGDKVKVKEEVINTTNTTSPSPTVLPPKRAFTAIFEDIWSLYPKRIGKKDALKHFLANVKTESDCDDIWKALGNYKASERVSKGFIQNGSTWFNNWRDWVEFEEKRYVKPSNGTPRKPDATPIGNPDPEQQEAVARLIRETTENLR